MSSSSRAAKRSLRDLIEEDRKIVLRVENSEEDKAHNDMVMAKRAKKIVEQRRINEDSVDHYSHSIVDFYREELSDRAITKDLYSKLRMHRFASIEDSITWESPAAGSEQASSRQTGGTQRNTGPPLADGVSTEYDLLWKECKEEFPDEEGYGDSSDSFGVYTHDFSFEKSPLRRTFPSDLEHYLGRWSSALAEKTEIRFFDRVFGGDYERVAFSTEYINHIEERRKAEKKAEELAEKEAEELKKARAERQAAAAKQAEEARKAQAERDAAAEEQAEEARKAQAEREAAAEKQAEKARKARAERQSAAEKQAEREINEKQYSSLQSSADTFEENLLRLESTFQQLDKFGNAVKKALADFEKAKVSLDRLYRNQRRAAMCSKNLQMWLEPTTLTEWCFMPGMLCTDDLKKYEKEIFDLAGGVLPDFGGDVCKFWKFISENVLCDKGKMDIKILSKDLKNIGFNKKRFKDFTLKLLKTVIPHRDTSRVFPAQPGPVQIDLIDIRSRGMSNSEYFQHLFDFTDPLNLDPAYHLKGGRNRRHTKFCRTSDYGIKVLNFEEGNDGGGVANAYLSNEITEIAELCCSEKILNKTIKGEYLLNIFAFAGDIDSSIRKRRSDLLKQLVIVILLCLSNRRLLGVPIKLDPLLFASIFINPGEFTLQQAMHVLFPRLPGHCEAIREFVDFMSGDPHSNACLEYSEMKIHTGLGGISQFLSHAGSHTDFPMTNISKDSEDWVLNPYLIPRFLNMACKTLRDAFAEILRIINPFFAEYHLDFDHVSDFTYKTFYDYVDADFYVTEFLESDPTFKTDNKIHIENWEVGLSSAGLFVYYLMSYRVCRDCLTFDPKDVPTDMELVGNRRREIQSLFETRCSSIITLYDALLNHEDPSQPPFFNDLLGRHVIIEALSFTRFHRRGDTDEEYYNRVKSALPGFTFDYSPPLSPVASSEWSRKRDDLCTELRSLNSFVRFAERRSLASAKNASVIDHLAISSSPLDKFDKAVLIKIQKKVNELRTVVLDAFDCLVTNHRDKINKWTTPVDDMLPNLSKYMEENNSMEPVINDLELNCPIAGKGKICAACSSTWCQFCFGDETPCEACLIKKSNFSVRVFCDLVTGKGTMVNETSKKTVFIHNGTFITDFSEQTGRFSINPFDPKKGTMSFGTCGMSITLRPLGLSIHARKYEIFAHQRHTIMELLDANDSGFGEA